MPKIFQRTTQPDVDLEDWVNWSDPTRGLHVKGDRGNRLRYGEDAVFTHEYDEDKWYVTSNRASDSWCFNEVFDAIQDGDTWFRPYRGPDLKVARYMGKDYIGKKGVLLAGEVAFRTDKAHFEWNGRTYDSTDYKGKEILIPDQQMWGWYEQRSIKVLKIFFPEGGLGAANYRRVVFGTDDDKYTHYPEKYGFMSRPAIAREESWKNKADKKGETYEDRLRNLNPERGKIGKYTWTQQRQDEINEESGLRVKHAPSILMINRYIKQITGIPDSGWKSFVKTYLGGSQGTGTGGTEPGRARPDHFTDHEIYRMFAGKHREQILDNTLFADDTLVVLKVGKTENAWWNKSQIMRRWRILKENLQKTA
jgi:hypothetical protein